MLFSSLTIIEGGCSKSKWSWNKKRFLKQSLPATENIIAKKEDEIIKKFYEARNNTISNSSDTTST